MHFEEINLEETHIRLTTDLKNQELKKHIYKLRYYLKDYIYKNNKSYYNISNECSCYRSS